MLAELEALWRQTRGNPAITVAVLDGPVDLSHPCFEGARLRTLATEVAPAGTSIAPSSHGTHVTSVLFGQHGAGGVDGVAPDCTGLIVPIYLPGPDGQPRPASQATLARAIVQAVDAGAHIINVSGGQLAPSGVAETFLADTVRHCAESGTLVVAAAGNDGCDCLHVPAALNSVLAVGATNAEGLPGDFSNWGAAYAENGIVCSGERIPGAALGGGVVEMTGTSFAAPIVTGIAALLMSLQHARGQAADPAAVRAAILDTATPCDPADNPQDGLHCRRLLAGTINIKGALGRVMDETQTLPQEERADTAAVEHAPVQQMPQTPIEEAGDKAVDMSQHSEPVTQVLQPAVQTNPARALGAPQVAPAALVTGSGSDIYASACCEACDGQPQQQVYAFGQIDYDFESWTRYEWFKQQMMALDYAKPIRDPSDPSKIIDYQRFGNPLDKNSMLDFLEDNRNYPGAVASLIWMLTINDVPVYAIRPQGSYTAETYRILTDFLMDQVVGDTVIDDHDPDKVKTYCSDRIAVAGHIVGNTMLLNGQVVPVIEPSPRGLHNWSTDRLITLVLATFGFRPDTEKGKLLADTLRQLFDKLYSQLQNLGVTSADRAINMAATNVYGLVEHWAREASNETGPSLMIQDIHAEPAKVARPGTDTWDVIVTMFNPHATLTEARRVTRITIDVGDVMPVVVGKAVTWQSF